MINVTGKKQTKQNKTKTKKQQQQQKITAIRGTNIQKTETFENKWD